MTDEELIARLRDACRGGNGCKCSLSEAADRIEALTADLARVTGERDEALTFLDNAVSKAPEPLRELGNFLAAHFDEDDWPTAERYLNAAATEATRLRADLDAAVGALEYYADQLCEGFCQDLPDLTYTDENCERDCGGCKARATIAKIKEGKL